MAHALSAQMQFAADVFEVHLRPVEAEEHLNDLALALREFLHGGRYLRDERAGDEVALRVAAVAALQQVEQATSLVVCKRCVHGSGAAGGLHDGFHLFHVDVERLGDFFVRGRALVLLREVGKEAVDFREIIYLIERQVHQTAVLGEGLQDALAYPPHGVGNEFEAARLVELLGGGDQSHVALVDEVDKSEPLPLILLCH